MSRVGVTGATGLLGWHVSCRLLADAGHDVVRIDRDVLLDHDRLAEVVAGCDAVVHAAGMSRDEPAVVEAGNPDLAERLVRACRQADVRPHVIHTNSIHHEIDNPYGRSKRRAAEILGAWAAETGARYTDLVLPNIFGEGGRPFHNSVVSTFCHQLANGKTPQVEVDITLELVHAQDMADHVVAAIESGETGVVRLKGAAMTVSQLLETLTGMHDLYTDGRLPDLGDPLAVQLFNTLRSYRYPQRYPAPFTFRTDNRGSLFEVVKETSGGQTFLSHTHPGITRGNHFHLRKVERFVVLEGEAVIRLRRLFSDHVDEFPVSGDAPAAVDIPTMHTHSITNTGSGDLLTLFWANEIFDEARPDTVAAAVDGSELA